MVFITIIYFLLQKLPVENNKKFPLFLSDIKMQIKCAILHEFKSISILKKNSIINRMVHDSELKKVQTISFNLLWYLSTFSREKSWKFSLIHTIQGRPIFNLSFAAQIRRQISFIIWINFGIKQKLIFYFWYNPGVKSLLERQNSSWKST